MLHPNFMLLHSLEIMLRERGKIDVKNKRKSYSGFMSKLMSALAIVDVLVSCNRQFFS